MLDVTPRPLRILVTVGGGRFWGGTPYADLRRSESADLPFTPADTRCNEVAAILFTSGSTGPPKGAVYTHGTFAAQVDALKDGAQIVVG